MSGVLKPLNRWFSMNRIHTESVVEGVKSDLLQIIPVDEDAVFNRVLEGEDTTLGLGFSHGNSINWYDLETLLFQQTNQQRVRRERGKGKQQGLHLLLLLGCFSSFTGVWLKKHTEGMRDKVEWEGGAGKEGK